MTLLELENAADALPIDQKRQLVEFLLARIGENKMGDKPAKGRHSVLDIPTFSVGAVLKPLTSDDDILGEMLEDRL